MKNYVVEVWTPIPEGGQTPEEKEWRINSRVTQSEGFATLIDAWRWVTDNHIEEYTVNKTECILDAS